MGVIGPIGRDQALRRREELAARMAELSNSCHNAVDGRFCEEHGVYHGDEDQPTGHDLYLQGLKNKKKREKAK